MKRFLSLLLCVFLVGCSSLPATDTSETETVPEPVETDTQTVPKTTGSFEAVKADPLTDQTYYNFLSNNSLDQSVIDAIRNFAFDSSAKLLTGKDNDNYSPVSLYVALAMATSGAKAETATQMFQALGLPNDKDALADAMNKLNQLLNMKTETGRIALANSIWNRSDLPFNEDYIRRLTEKFQASLFQVDFDDPETGKQMSDWVAKQTENLIKADFDVSNELASVLLNTLYFKESWETPFSPDATASETFRGQDGEVTKDFLKSSTEKQYINSNGVEGVILPFEFSRMILLKKPGANPVDILKDPGFKELLNSGSNALVNLKLPKFKFDQEYDLNELVQKLGIIDAMDPSLANFSGMSPVEMFISQIKQNSHIGLDETGVEAAAMTSISMGTTSMPMTPPEVDLTFDEPFLFIIESGTGIPLFIGTLSL